MNNKTGLGVFYGVLAGALWGGIFLAPKLVPDFSALQLSTARYLTYGRRAGRRTLGWHISRSETRA
ncbi:hypothetical protein O8B41_26485 [Agrobacterium rhizogenes]|nr:hypothetical protein [Rhizobium rhizogenes]MCZ7472749.1 hypothetical protein [Rhizobium rhizogenes]